jgi:sugar lactone lactonase YvrE
VPAVFTGELETTVPLTFSKICTGSDAMIHLLDASGGSVWRMSPDGWRVVELGGTASKSHWSSATAVACDGAGGFYVLDSALSTVHRYNPAGERVGRFGKKAGRDDPHGIPGAISMAGSPVNASVAGRAIAGTQDGYVAVLLRDRPFGVHLFSPDGVPRSPFPAKADNQRPCSRVAVRSEGTVYLVPQTGGYIEEFNRDGGLVRRREIPATDASGLALSPGGTLYVLDMRKRVIVIVPQDGAVGKVNIPRSVRSPTDIACDGYGTVGLLDGRARTISLYHPAPRGAAGAE